MNDFPPKRGLVRPARIEDVARLAGVSPITVSRALSQPDKVRPETRARVERAVAKTGYMVNPFASSLKSGHSPIIAVFASEFTNPHFAFAMQGVMDAISGSGYRTMFAQIAASSADESATVQSMLPFRPAGAIFGGYVQTDAVRRAVRALAIPVVEMWGYQPDPVDMLVATSAIEGGRLIGRHFAERGFRRVAYAGPPDERGAHRLEGLRAGLGDGAEPVVVVSAEEARSIGDGMAALDAVLAAAPDADAIFLAGDALAAGALLRAQATGIDVPARLAIAGYGGLDIAVHLKPGITTVKLASYEIGVEAGEMLLARLSGRKVPDPIRLVPPTLEIRGSTGG